MTSSLHVSDVMTRDVVTVAEDAPYKEVVELLAGQHISAVPVLDRRGGIAGVVSETDLLRKEEFQQQAKRSWLARRRQRRASAAAAGRLAGDFMSRPAVTIEQTATVPEAARAMAAHGITRLVVTGDDDGLAGIVTRSDLLKTFLAPDDRILHQIRHDIIERGLWADPAKIEIVVKDGVVTLSGEVDERSTAVVAEKLTAAVDGVVGVDNLLTWGFDDLAAKPDPLPSPEFRRPS
ncbi:CBS domain-containing protein [Kribbella sp. NPDC004875]|uniref:CBS domain-containing protein n=1 Tax=Kribbella sp. NPDC004875 TaxID=3364107 RepID=UPI003695684C